MWKMVKYLRPYWWQCLVLIASTGVQVFGTLMLPTKMSEIVNEGIMKADMGFIVGTGLLMVLFALISALGALGSSYFSAKLGAALGRDIRNDVFAKIMTFSISETNAFSTASLITRTTTDIATVQQTMTMMLSMMLRVPMMAIGAIVGAVSLAPDMTWIIVGAVALLLTFVSVIIAITVPKFEIYRKLQDKINLLTRENLTGVRVIRAFNNSARERKKFEATNEKLMKVDIFISKMMSLNSPLMSLIMNGTALLVIWIGISHLEVDASYLGKMMAFMQYATQVIMSFLFLTILFVMLPRANVSAKRVNKIMDTNSKIKFKNKTENNFNNVSSVEFRNVSFSYPDADEKVLDNISFVAKAGETTAFVGSTGSGKSTLINLVPRFYDATEGEVLVDGVKITEYSEADLMRKIGYVPQKGFLFSGTVKSNILFGVKKEDLSEDEIKSKNKNGVISKAEEAEILEKRMREAAKVAQAAEFIEKLPEEYDAPITESGTNVSGGQRQRLAIARAIAKKPEVYIFDDAFSALDMKTDAKLRAALKPVTKDSVVLIVAQRISTVKDAEQIVVLEKGKCVGKGTHLELLRNCKVYREICKSQLSKEEYEREVENAGVK